MHQTKTTTFAIFAIYTEECNSGELYEEMLSNSSQDMLHRKIQRVSNKVIPGRKQNMAYLQFSNIDIDKKYSLIMEQHFSKHVKSVDIVLLTSNQLKFLGAELY